MRFLIFPAPLYPHSQGEIGRELKPCRVLFTKPNFFARLAHRRPKSGRSCPLFDLNEWVSDLSESSSDESDISSSDEEGFSMLLDSVILGKGGKKEERRRRREERDIRR